VVSSASTRAFEILDLEVLHSALVDPEPYDHLFVQNVIRSPWKPRVLADLPRIDKLGSHPLDKVRYGESFEQLVNELKSGVFRTLIERKFAIDLSRYETVVTVRGRSGAPDGQIHTDRETKVVTLLLYLNPQWPHEGGNLRLLRTNNLDDYVQEIPALFGNMLVFRRSGHSWHGHLPYYGERLSVQMNWMKREQSALARRVAAFFSPALVNRERPR
jgi:SM-20-related protein